MPLCEFAFVVDSAIAVADAVTSKARETFGEGVSFVAEAKARSGTIRYFKNRGLGVVKKSGRFYMTIGSTRRPDLTKRIVWASINVPLSYFQRFGPQAGVDLTSLGLDGI